jgi:hypothetical protein
MVFYRKFFSLVCLPAQAVPPPTLFIELLMTFLCRPEYGCRADLRKDWTRATDFFCENLVAGVQSCSFLRFVVEKNYRTVLGAGKISLPVSLRRIVKSPENIEELVVRNYSGIKNDAHRFNMTGCSGFNLVITRIGKRATSITCDGLDNPVDLPEHCLNVPETPCGKSGALIWFLFIHASFVGARNFWVLRSIEQNCSRYLSNADKEPATSDIPDTIENTEFPNTGKMRNLKN